MPTSKEDDELRKQLFSIFGGATEIGRSDGTWYLYKPGRKIPATGEHYDQTNLDVIAELVKLIHAREEAARLEAEIKAHDDYWHNQRLIEEEGIGPVALANKEATELELRRLLQSQQKTAGKNAAKHFKE